MKNEDKWIQDIRNRMEDYSEPLPAGMWEQLESELDTPKVIPMWRKWQAAAAAVLVLAVSSLTLWLLNNHNRLFAYIQNARSDSHSA